MGQKVNPIGFRLQYNKNWEALWYKNSSFSENILNDIEIKKYIKKNYQQCGIASIFIERLSNKVQVTIKASKPGILIGKKGMDVEKINKAVKKISGANVEIKISEIERSETNASILAQSVARQLEARSSFKKVVKKTIQSAIKSGANGIKITCSGRLAGADIARSETYKEGSIPLHTIRSNIDYSTCLATTTYGIIGVKVWIYKGFSEKKKVSIL
jgi:small subunit ribosomal protein S3